MGKKTYTQTEVDSIVDSIMETITGALHRYSEAHPSEEIILTLQQLKGANLATLVFVANDEDAIDKFLDALSWKNSTAMS